MSPLVSVSTMERSAPVDGSASNDGSNLLEEIRVAFLLHRLEKSNQAPTGYDILKMVCCRRSVVVAPLSTNTLGRGCSTSQRTLSG